MGRAVVEVTTEPQKPSDNWCQRGACFGLGFEAMFGKGVTSSQQRQMCQGCAVRPDCLEASLGNFYGGLETEGSWAGLSLKMRRKIRRVRYQHAKRNFICDLNKKEGQVSYLESRYRFLAGVLQDDEAVYITAGSVIAPPKADADEPIELERNNLISKTTKVIDSKIVVVKDQAFENLRQAVYFVANSYNMRFLKQIEPQDCP